MKKYLSVILSIFFIVAHSIIYGQRVIGDCTITYQISAEQNTIDSNSLKSAYKKFYVSGGKSLTEISFNGFEQKTYYNENTDDIYILYKMNKDNYMRKVSKNEWEQQFIKYKDAKIEILNDTKDILGYVCKKGKSTLKDGTVINFYYTTELKTIVSEIPYEFSAINGLVLQYEAIIQNNYRIAYTASDINFNPVPTEKFVLPKSGYRLLNNNDKF
ncbi:MAG: hypothetical protein PW786_10160 [Arachidicoccus sp.]|nr:hypothetical protein [Arachidicoccus sp.]